MHAENSWAAFEAAVADGADAIECDVQGTRDGVLVIRHDLAIGNRLVAECVRRRARGSSSRTSFASPILLAWAPRGEDQACWSRSRILTCAVRGRRRWSPSSPWRERIVVGAFHGPALAALKARAPADQNVADDGQRGRGRRTWCELARWPTTRTACTRAGKHRSPQSHRLLDASCDNAARERRGLSDHALARGARKRIAGPGRALPGRSPHQYARSPATHRGSGRQAAVQRRAQWRRNDWRFRCSATGGAAPGKFRSTSAAAMSAEQQSIEAGGRMARGTAPRLTSSAAKDRAKPGGIIMNGKHAPSASGRRRLARRHRHVRRGRGRRAARSGRARDRSGPLCARRISSPQATRCN